MKPEEMSTGRGEGGVIHRSHKRFVNFDLNCSPIFESDSEHESYTN